MTSVPSAQTPRRVSPKPSSYQAFSLARREMCKETFFLASSEQAQTAAAATADYTWMISIYSTPSSSLWVPVPG